MWGKWECIWKIKTARGYDIESVTEGMCENKRSEIRFICFSQCEVSQGPTWECVMVEALHLPHFCASISLSPNASEPGLPKAHITYSFLPSPSAAVTVCVPHTPGRCASQSKKGITHSTSCLSFSNTNTYTCTPNRIPQARHVTAYTTLLSKWPVKHINRMQIIV